MSCMFEFLQLGEKNYFWKRERVTMEKVRERKKSRYDDL